MAKSPSKADLTLALSHYTSLLSQRAKSGKAVGAKSDLVALDAWLWDDLQQRIQKRAEEDKEKGGGGGYLTPDELKEVMRWKLARGKFRPTLPSLIASNAPATVVSTTRAALLELSQAQVKSEATAKAKASASTTTTTSTSTSSNDPHSSLPALQTLSTLRGVGPATASLLLSLFSPHTEPFLCDEAWYTIPTLRGRKIEYTVKGWKVFKEQWEQWKVGEIRWDQGDADKLEKAAWCWWTEQKQGVGSAKEEMAEKEDKRGKRKADQNEEEVEQLGRAAAKVQKQQQQQPPPPTTTTTKTRTTKTTEKVDKSAPASSPSIQTSRRRSKK